VMGGIGMIELLRALVALQEAQYTAVQSQGTPKAGAWQERLRAAKQNLMEKAADVAPGDPDRLLAYLEAMQATERARLGVVASLDELTINAHEKAKIAEWSARDRLRAAVVAGVKL
jgi:hypothetical protein